MNSLQRKKLAFMSIVNRVKGFVRTVIGALPLTLKGCVDESSITDYKIFGQCVQDGEPTPDNPIEVISVGEKTKNLIEYPYLDTSKTLNGLTFIDNGDGTVTVNGVAEANTAFNIYTKNTSIWDGITPNEMYTASVDVDGEYTGNISYVCNYYPEGSSSYTSWMSSAVNKPVTKACPTNIAGIRSYIYIYAGTMLDNVTIKPQLEKGETATPYEPYGKYKIPVTVSGKNLFDISSAESVYKDGSYRAFVNHDNQTIECRYPINYDGVNIPCNITSLKAGTYTISADMYIPEEVDGNGLYIGVGTSYKNFGLYKRGFEKETWVRISTSFTIPEEAVFKGVRCQPYDIIYSATGRGIIAKNIILEENTTATDYEPYHEPITTNIYLDEPLRKVGDYADYIDFEGGKVVRQVGEYVFTGLETDQGGVMSSGDTFGYTIQIDSLSRRDGVRYGICNRLIQGTYTSNSKTSQFALLTRANHPYVYIYFEKTTFPNFETYSSATAKQIIKDWYNNGIPMIFYYELAEPTETPIALPTIPTFKGTSIVAADTITQPSNAEVKYFSSQKGE